MASKMTEIISVTTVKPSSPTPPHLRTFKLSLADQLIPNWYYNHTFFYPNTDAATHHHHGIDFFYSKSKLLKEALSKTLTTFYPVAGRLLDESSINCNDEGVVVTESKTDCLLSDILASPDFDFIYTEFVSANYNEAMQVSSGSLLRFNIILFRCGGIAVSIAESHKVFDLSSLMIFLKSLSAACCGSAEPIVPDFHTAPALFPSREVPNSALFGSPRRSNPAENNPRKSCTRRFLFTASKIQELKIIAANNLEKEGYEFDYLSRVNVVMAFLWQCLTTSLIKTSFFRPTLVLLSANIRNRIEPPLPSNVFGNLSFVYATDVVEKGSDVRLGVLLKKLLNLRVSIVESGKRFDSEEVVRTTRSVVEAFENKDDVKLYVCASWCRFEFYEIDFGMGKPAWVTTISPEHQESCIYLLDTKEGGVEALISLEEEEMKAFKCNEELLQFVNC